MRNNLIIVAVASGLLLSAVAYAVFSRLYKDTIMPSNTTGSLYDFEAKLIDGTPKPLKDYKGKVVLVVNTASKCGLTPQYEGLQKLYVKYKDKGLVILGFPANNFGAQEPGTNAEITEFCTTNYGVTFPMFEKISVGGDDTHPLYKWLITSTENKAIEWNFAKFLINKDGSLSKRFGSRVAPTDANLTKAIEEALAK